MQQRYGRPQVASSFEALIEGFPQAEFAKMTRSTVPLLAWWKDAQRVRELLTLLDAPPPKTATFEYPVRAGCDACGGRGKASFTDLMLETERGAIAIEAKHRETVYEDVKSWLGDSPSANKRNVLRHWVKCCLGVDAAVDTLVYQIVHRAASAVVAAGTGGTAHVVHLLFDSSHADDYVAASNTAAAVFATRSDLRFSVVEIPMRPGRDYEAIAGEVESRGPEALRDAFVSDAELFVFGSPRVR